MDQSDTTDDFRRDINGLRALAIFLVVAFHIFPAALPGGFVGVDVFFVISGYLISRIVLRGLKTHSFDFKHFYRRRAIRIFPALLIVLVATCAFGWISMYSFEYQGLGEHAVGAIAFASNFVLWREAGYFDVTTSQKPLMHLWSLAIEEQFYVLFPLAMWVAFKRRWNLVLVILAVLLLSFATNVAQSRTDTVGDFFNPASRAWEILAGVLIAAIEIFGIQTITQPLTKSVWQFSASFKEICSTLGVVLIVAAAVLFDDTLRFPGWCALVPTIGAVLLIIAGPAAAVNRLLLSNPIAAWLGLISYPLYLWHWPIILFVAILQPSGSLILIRVLEIATSLILASLTFLAIERPVASMRNRRRQVLVVVVPALLIAAFGYTGYSAAGFPMREVSASAVSASTYAFRGRYTAGDVKAGCGVPSSIQENYAFCEHDSRGSVRFALLGDSKAAALAPGVFSRWPRNGFWMFVGGYRPNSTPVPVLSDAPEFSSHQATLRPALQALTKDNQIQVVVLATATRSLFTLQRADTIAGIEASKEYPIALAGLDRSVSYLVDAGKRVVLLVDNPTFRDPMLCVSRTTSVSWIDAILNLKAGFSTCEVSRATQLKESARYRELLSSVAARHPGKVYIFDTLDSLCNSATQKCSAMEGEHHLYSFTDHISAFAADKIAQKLVPYVEAIAGPLTSRP